MPPSINLENVSQSYFLSNNADALRSLSMIALGGGPKMTDSDLEKTLLGSYRMEADDSILISFPVWAFLQSSKFYPH